MIYNKTNSSHSTNAAEVQWRRHAVEPRGDNNLYASTSCRSTTNSFCEVNFS